MLAAHLVDTGTHTGTDWPGVTAAGARVETHEMAVHAWSGGLIREIWSTSDRLDTLEQLGRAAL